MRRILFYGVVMNTAILFIRSAIVGGLGGALFGVGFGLVASIFKNGPPVLVAIQQSWWWFAVGGLCMGLAWAGARYADAKSLQQHSQHKATTR